MPLERLTMLVLPRAGDAHARRAAPRSAAVAPQPDVFEVVPWEETDDPDRARCASSPVRPARAAIGDQTWARFVLDLQRALPSTAFVRASRGRRAVRMVKDDDEIAALRAGRARGRRVAAEMRLRPFAGRTELDVHRELVERMLAARSRARRTSRSSRRARTPPARTTSRRRPRRSATATLVLCDFGGTMQRLLLRHHAHVPRRRADRGGRATLYAVLARRAGGRRARRDGRDAVRRRRRRARGESSPMPGSASTSCIASGTASAPRRTRTRTWSPGNAAAARRRPRVQRRARHLPPRSLRHAARRHRRRDRLPGPVRLNDAPRDLAASPESTDEARRRRRSCCSGPTGGLLFCWVTTRRREVSLGYGWLLRSVFGVLAVGAAASVRHRGAHVRAQRRARALGVSRSAAPVALVVSVVRRGARACAAARSATRRAAGARRRDGRYATRPTPMPRRREPRAASSRPSSISSRRSSACIGLLAAAEFAGGPYALAAVAPRRRRRVPRCGERRDAARPLVPRAARACRATA